MHDKTHKMHERPEAEIARTSQEWQHTFDFMRDAIWILGKDQVVVRSNKAAEIIFDRPCEEMVGKHCWEIVHGTKQPIPESPVMRARKSLQPESMELQIGDNWFNITVNPVLDAKGQFDGAVHVATDITKYINANAALRENEEKFKNAFQYSAIGMALVSLDGKWLKVNSKVSEILGYSEDELLKTTFQQITHPDDLNADLDFVAQLLAGTIENYYMEKRYFHKQGHIIYVVLAVSLVRDDSGNPLYFVSQIEDITKRKLAEEEKTRLEAQLRQAQKMEAVGLLAGGIAHDFNNMLSVINGYSELLLMEFNPSDIQYKRMQEIYKAGLRSADLTRQLLAFARKQTISPKRLDLNDSITAMLKILQRLIGENIKLEWKPASKIWKVKMDPSQIDQILTNLLVNARDAISDIGKVIIETDQEELDESFCKNYPDLFPGKYVVLSVIDDGCGMEEETLSRIFEPFYTTKGVGEGTGLGLATIFGIVKQNNGGIIVRSEPGKGTAFRIYLPRDESADLEKDAKSAVPELLTGTETVLLVEDDTSILVFAKVLLQQLGYTVLTSSHSLEAVKIAKEYKGEIHLLVTDVIMPVMSGRDLRDKILSIHPDIKCLFISGYTADIISKNGVLDENVNFLPKPFTAHELSVKLRETLTQERGS